jgi:putative hydrolase of the HAD superfamily
MVRAVLLDLDDTLFDHRYCARTALDAVRGCHECFAAFSAVEFERTHAQLLEELHIRVMAGELDLTAARRERFRRLFGTAGVTADDQLVGVAAVAYRERYVSAWRAVPGAAALLAALKTRARIGIVTNNLLQEQQEKMRFCGFAAHVDVLIVSETAGVSKPDPAIFLLALNRLGCSAADAVMVGDSWRIDVLGARAAGIRAIWLNRTGAPCPDVSAGVPEIRALEPVSEVLDLVFSGTEAAIPS